MAWSDLEHVGKLFVNSLVFCLLGVAMFGASFWVIVRITPFSVRREIEEDQNLALGIIIGAVLLGIAIIIASAIH